MCLAIYKPKDVIIPEDVLENGFDNNSDGAGFTVFDGKLRSYKGYWSFSSFMRAFAPWQKHGALIHFRIGTHGKKNKDNCHPFNIDDRWSVIHNGVLDIKCHQKKMSDTWHFTKLVLAPLFNGMPWNHSALQYIVEQAIGRSNKIAVMNKDGKVMIFNEEQGTWKDGAWYSNYSYQKRSFTSSYSSTDSKTETNTSTGSKITYFPNSVKVTPGKPLVTQGMPKQPLSGVAWDYWKRMHCGAPADAEKAEEKILEGELIDFEGEQFGMTEEQREISRWIEKLQREAGLPVTQLLDDTTQKVKNLLEQ